VARGGIVDEAALLRALIASLKYTF